MADSRDSGSHVWPGNWWYRLGRLRRLALKELHEILRDRRTILTLVLMPLLLYPVLCVAFQQFFLSTLSGQVGATYRIGFRSQREFQLLVGYLGLPETGAIAPSTDAAPPLLDSAKTARLEYFLYPELAVAAGHFAIDVGVQVQGGLEEPLKPEEDLALDIEFILSEDYASGRGAVRYLEERLVEANQRFLQARLTQLGVTQRADPVRAMITLLPAERSDTGTISLAAVIPLILILMTITGAVYPAIDLTAGERERGTLEILVAAPVPRIGLLLAKYVAVVTVAVMTATVNLISMTVTILVSGLGPALFGKAGLSLGSVAAVFGLLFLFAAFFSAVLLILASYARSFKEAQAYLIPLMLVSLAPGMLSLTPGLRLTGLLSIAPLINIVLLARDIFEMTAQPIHALLVVVSTLLYASLAIFTAARIFGSEAVLFSSPAGWSDFLRRPQVASDQPTISSGLLCLAMMFPGHFLLTNLVARMADVSFQIRLGLASLASAVLFLGLPMAAALMGRVRLKTSFALLATSWWTIPAALALGLSLWPWAHELVLLQQQWVFERLDPEILAPVKRLLEEFRNISPLWVFGATAVVPAVVEELFFRGFLFTALRSQWTARNTVIGTAIFFGLFHLLASEGLTVVRFLPSTLLGLVLGWVRWRTGSIFPSMVVHVCHNGFLILVSYYQPWLTAHGWGISEESHLPTPWLLGSGLAIAASFVLIWWTTRPQSPVQDLAITEPLTDGASDPSSADR